MEGKFIPKAISKRIKVKGLLKLKNYCQLCKKHCRDGNGFKCHTMSEGHIRQMQLFGANKDVFVEKYSQEFENAFLDHLNRCHGRNRVAANEVYNGYISDRDHVHMNATKWGSLTEFVKYLGMMGKCKVEYTEKGLFITYNAMDSESLFHEVKSKLVKLKLMEEDKDEKEIAKQILHANNSAVVPMELDIQDGKKCVDNKTDEFQSSSSDIDRANKRIVFGLRSGVKRKGEYCRRIGVAFEEEDVKKIRIREPYWLSEGIVVKVTSNSVEKKYYNKKGVVRKVLDKYSAEIEMLDNKNSKHLVEFHQDDLQTVLPQIGGFVRMVKGSYRGFKARLLSIDTLNFCAEVQLDTCIYRGRVLPQVAYDDICKLFV